jgi:acetolactate synthase-1/3 small subunit
MEAKDHKHVLNVLVQNQPGVLAHIAGMFASRGFNIDSLVVGRTEDPALSRIVLVTSGDEPTLEQVRKQLGKIVTTVKVRDLTEQSCVRRDLLLIQVHCPPERRGEIRQITEVFRGSIVDVASRSVIIQLTGSEEKVEAFIELCRPYGIQQLARTGLIAIPRASQRAEAGRSQRPSRRRGANAKPPAQQPAVPMPPS